MKVLRPAPPAAQAYNWVREPGYHAGNRRRVIAEKRRPMPAVSSEGVRWDALVLSLGLALLLILGFLFSDLKSLAAGGDRIGALQAGIRSLESTNSLLRSEVALARRHPVLVQKELEKARSEEPQRVVILSPAPQE